MTIAADPALAAGTSRGVAVDGDASTYLEELVVGVLPSLELRPASSTDVEVEVVGPHLRLSGTICIGQFRRLSDFMNHRSGLIELRDATILRRNGDPTKVQARSIWLSPHEVSLIGQNVVGAQGPRSSDMYVPKVARGLIVVTPGHTLTGEAYVMAEADLSVYIESADPTFIAMTDVRTRSLADRRVIARYPFGLLNRRHIVAATELLPGMAPAGRTVL